MAHTELNVRERRRIEDMLNAKMSVGEIAADIGRHKSTSIARSSGTITTMKRSRI
jgi:IS30 family transposase